MFYLWVPTNVQRIRAMSIGNNQVLDLVEMDETLAYAQLDNAIRAGEGWVGACMNDRFFRCDAAPDFMRWQHFYCCERTQHENPSYGMGSFSSFAALRMNG